MKIIKYILAITLILVFALTLFIKQLPPPAPTNLKAEVASASSVNLSWDKVYGAEGYEIVRSTDINNGFKYLNTINSNRYTDENLKSNTVYYYKVHAYKRNQNKKIFGKYTSTTTIEFNLD